jgi:MinD-like ATPase involved in chromosome partitioning or flagellar assembly
VFPRHHPKTETPGHPVDHRGRDTSSRSGPGCAVAVTGATGAPGRTFISINLAFALREQGQRVALVDADPHLGAIAAQLDLAEDRSLTYLAHEATLRRIDDSLVTGHMQSAFGVDVLAGRAIAGAADNVSEPLLTEVVRLLTRRYDYVVMDVGALDCY